VQDTYAHVVL